jgi:hypothetical protein
MEETYSMNGKPKTHKKFEICDFHRCDSSDCFLLGCDTV